MKLNKAILIFIFIAILEDISFSSQNTNVWWTSSNNIPQPPLSISAGGSLTYYTDGTNRYLYAFFGGTTRNFYRLNLSNIYSQSWESRCQAPDTVLGTGAHLVTSGNNKIRAVRGAGTNSYEFWEYDVPSNRWYNAPYESSPTAGAGKCIVNVSSTDYYAFKGSGSGFLRYRISADGCTTNEWQAMANAPWNVAVGGALAYNGGDYIFALRGGSRNFARYSISGNSWLARASWATAVGNAGAGASLAYVPSGIGECTDASGCVYALRGGASASFLRYNVNANTWTIRANAPWTVAAGGSLVYAGGNYLYAFRGNSSVSFARYNITNNTWDDASVADPPEAVSGGGSLTYLGGAYSDYIYARPTSANTTFWRYSISQNSWTSLSSLPYAGETSAGNILAGNATASSIYAFAGSGTLYPDFWRYDINNNKWGPYALSTVTGDGVSLLKYDDDDAYLVFGNSQTYFYRYRSSSNSWTSLTDLPQAVSAGTSATYARDAGTDYVYLFRGNTTTAGVWRWQIPSGTSWTARTSAPAAFGAGSASAWTSDNYIYVLRGGGTTTFWRYCISSNNWNCNGFTPASSPATVGTGGSLVWTNDDYIFAFRGNGTTNFWRYRWRDSIAPNAITDLTATRSCTLPTTITLQWTGRGDDGDESSEITKTSASSYEIRYRTDGPITEANWSSSTQPSGSPVSHSGGFGALQTFNVTGLSENTTYYFAVKARDEVPNYASLSNVVSIKTPTGGQGTANISPEEVSAGTGGNNITIIYNKGSDELVCGRVYLNIPSGWSAPINNATCPTGTPDPGCITITAGSLNIVGNQVQVTNLSGIASLTINYKNADAQTSPAVATFTIYSHSGPGTPQQIATSPTIEVVAGTGEGSASISPSAVVASSTANNIQIFYTSGNHAMNKGRVYVDVPNGWSAPLPPSNPSCPAGEGCVSVTGGGSPSVNTSGQQIQISNITCSASTSCITINYNNATSQSTVTCSQIWTIYSSAGAVSPSEIASSPSMNVAGVGQGTGTPTPNMIVISSTNNTINFTYTAGTNDLCNGRVYIDVPVEFPDPPSTSTTANGYSTSNKGSLTVSGRQIQVTGINLTAGNGMTITYGSKVGGGTGFTAPSTSGNYTFSMYSSTGNVAPSLIASSPVIGVTSAGEGTASISPANVGAGTSSNTITITYNAGVSAISNGRVYVDVPTSWTQPTTSNTSASQGTLNCTGMQIQVSGVNCSSGQTNCVIITYGTGSGITAQSNPANNVQFTVYSSTAPTDPLPIGTSPKVNVLATGEGTGSISPSSVVVSSTGNTLSISYVAGSTAMSNGRVYIDIPPGWSTPSLVGTEPGYTVTNKGIALIDGRQIRVTGINMSAGGSMTVTYGSKTAGGPGATAESEILCSRQFPVLTAVGDVTPMPISSYPIVNVSATGQGAASIISPSPAEVGQNTPNNTIIIQYTAGVNNLCNGRVYINVPSGWSEPSIVESNAGYTTSSIGTVTVSGQQIRVGEINLSAGNSMTITYGSTSGGGPGATAGSSTGLNIFTVLSSTGEVTPTDISTSPSVNVLATGKGNAVLSPSCVPSGSSGNNISITYTPNASFPLTNGRVYATVPSGWTQPTTTGCPGNQGCVSCSLGTVEVSGMDVRCGGINLSFPSTLTINYTNATAPSAASTAVEFKVKDAVGNVTPMAISTSPTTNVARNGEGTNNVVPEGVIVSSTGNTLVFTFTASSAGMKDGLVYIDVPCGAGQFSPCPSTTPSNNGYTTSTKGSVNTSGVPEIRVSGINLSPYESFTITYGDKSGGGSGVTAPTTTGNYTFITQSSTGNCVTPTNIALSPVVQVLPEGGGGTGATATAYSSQRKIARNSYGFWMFYDNGTNFVNKFSTTGLTWSGAEQTVFTTTTRVGSIWVDTTNNAIYAIGWPTISTTNAAVRKGSIASASNPTWETQVSPTMSGISNATSALCSITRSSDEYIWLACEMMPSSGNYNVSVTRSTSANSVSNFSPYAYDSSRNSATRNFAPIILPGSNTGQAYLIYNRAGTIEGRLINTNLSFNSVETIATGMSGNWSRSISGISDSNYNIHLVFIASDGTLRYRYRQSGTWQTIVTLDSNTTCYSPSIQLRGSDLFVVYNRGNNIYMKKGVYPYASSNWENSFIIKTASVTTTHYAVLNAIDTEGVTFIHTSGTASPYSVLMEVVSQGAASLTTPSSGEVGAGTSGNTIVFNFTAGQSGMTGGKLYIDFPTGWGVSQPNVSGGGAPSVSQVGQQTQITGISLSPSNSMTITYSNTTTAGSVGTSTIKFSSAGKTTVTNPAEIQTNPTIYVKPIASISLSNSAVSIANSSSDDVLVMSIQNPSTSVIARANNFKFQFKNAAGINLTTAQAQALFSAMRIYLDDGDNNYDAGDIQVGEVLSSSFSLTTGVQQINCDGSANCQVGTSSSKTYLLVLTTQANATSANPNAWKVFCDADTSPTNFSVTDLSGNQAMLSTAPSAGVTTKIMKSAFWRIDTTTQFYTSPSLVYDTFDPDYPDRMYIGGEDGVLRCINISNGTILWTYNAGNPIRSSAFAWYDDFSGLDKPRIWFGDEEGILHGRIDDGGSSSSMWTNINACPSARIRSSPSIRGYNCPSACEIRLYVGCYNGSNSVVNAYDAFNGGSELWTSSELGGNINHTLAANTNVFLSCDDGRVYKLLTSNGSVDGSFLTSGAVKGEVMIGGNIGGSEMWVAGGNVLYKINYNTMTEYGGSWTDFNAGSSIYASPYTVTLSTSYIYIATTAGKVYCINRNTGALVWQYPSTGSIGAVKGGVYLEPNEALYLYSDDGYVYALNPDTGSLLSNWPAYIGMVGAPAADSRPMAITIVSDENSGLIVTSTDGKIFYFPLE